MKKLIFVHGEKGGVGKSQTVIWIVESLLKKERDISIIEADEIGDINARYFPNGLSKPAPLSVAGDSSEAGINRIFDAVASTENDIVIVNLPAAASARLEPVAGDLVEALREIECQIYVIFVSDNQSHSLRFFESSMKSGFMSMADKTALVNNLFFDSYPDQWPITKSKQKANFVTSMPKIEIESLEVIKSNVKPIFELIDESSLNVFQKVRVRGWIKAAEPLVNFILE